MKKDKHITININCEQYEQIKTLAEKQRRTLAGLTSLIISEYLKLIKNE